MCKNYKRIVGGFFLGLLMNSCAIENDIPYPLIEGSITAMQVEGQRAAEGDDSGSSEAVIDKKARTVTIYVNDSVDISRLKITRMVVEPRDAELLVDSVLCDNAEKFPFHGFASLDSIPVSSNTRIDFSKAVNFTVKTYQEYLWQVTVKQIVQRDIDVEGQTRDAVIDENSRNVIIYVSADQDLSNLKVNKMNLGGEYGKVSPDPTTVKDFSSPVKFNVRRSWEEYSYEWTVFVYHDDGSSSGGDDADTFVMVGSATIKGSIQSGKTPVVEYKKQGDSSWQTVPASDVTTSGTSFTATISGLSGGTTYVYRVSVDGVAGSEQTFTTAKEVALTNGGLEDWHQSGNQWNPWAESASPFWGTGNKGSSIIGMNITTPVDESVSGKAAWLTSKYVPLKGLAAGNLFTGDFELDGMNGILTLGREFTTFPTSLRFYCKYETSKITQAVDRYEHLKGENDMCHIYVALTTEKVTIRTKNEEAFNPNASSVIAYGEFISDQNVSGSEKNGYKKVEIPLEYKKTGVTPKYIIIVCSASRYGDFFTGGENSKLWLDEMELGYE